MGSRVSSQFNDVKNTPTRHLQSQPTERRLKRVKLQRIGRSDFVEIICGVLLYVHIAFDLTPSNPGIHAMSDIVCEFTR